MEALYGASSSTPSKTKIHRKHHHFTQQESDLRHNLIRWRSGKSVDPRLLRLLEFFTELYMERKEFFKKVFPELFDEFAELYEKFGEVLSQRNGMAMKDHQTLQRSLSFGSPRRGFEHDDESTFRLQRFKVRTPVLSGVGAQQGGQDGHGNQGDTIGSK